MAVRVHFCTIVLVVGLAGLLVSHTHSLHLAKGLRHSLRESSVEVVMALSHILRVKTLLCSPRVPMEALETVFRILQVLMEAQETVFYIPQVLMEAREIVFHILRVQMAALAKVVFHSLERTDFFRILQAHPGRRIARDDLPKDSR